MYLSYSGRKKAKNCLFDYWHVYKNHTPFEASDDRLGSIYGTVVGKVFEDFYNEKMWRKPGVRELLEKKIPILVDQTLKEEQLPRKGREGGVILWKGDGENQNPKGLYVDRDELVRDAVYTVGVGLKSIKQELLIGKDAVAELKLDSDVEGHRLGGRADFVMTQVKTRHRLILDGKGSAHRGKYVDPDQLKWYAMLHQIRFNYLPDRTAFLYWKFEPPTSLDWYEFSRSDTDALLEDTLKTISLIESKTKELPSGPLSLSVVREVFEPHATIQNCMFCPYASEKVCPKGFEKRSNYESRLAARNV